MAVTERTVRNKRNSAGELTGKAGTVYDVNVKYKSGGKSKTYSRKGFLTKKDALQHEAEMKAKLTNPAYTPPSAVQRKMTVREYMTELIRPAWLCKSPPQHRGQLSKPHEEPHFPLYRRCISEPALPGHAGRYGTGSLLKRASLSPRSNTHTGHGLSHWNMPAGITTLAATGQGYFDEVRKAEQDARSLHGRPDAAAAGCCHGDGVGADRSAGRIVWASPQRDHRTAVEERGSG